jgi:hypothetical protein
MMFFMMNTTANDVVYFVDGTVECHCGRMAPVNAFCMCVSEEEMVARRDVTNGAIQHACVQRAVVVES